jgi:anti-sigma regulatory factor (Ser/Thr protein kinase)
MNAEFVEPLASPPRRYRIALVVGDHSPGHLRRITRAYLRLWDVPQLADTVGLIVTEFVTNVYRHVPGRWCALTLLPLPDGVRVEVQDHCPVLPVLRTADELLEGGRGLALVDLLSDTWDLSLHRAGKTVWAEARVRRAAVTVQPGDVERTWS